MGRTDQTRAEIVPRLARITIDDYVLIAHADVLLAGGLTMFTGETGSGKTMLIGALAFALGERAGSEIVRTGSTRARVTLEIEPDDAMYATLANEGFEIDPGEPCIVVREVTSAGRSSARISGTAASAAQLRALIAPLVDIVGQHAAQRLLQPAFAIDLLDRFAGREALDAREHVARAYAACSELDERLTALAVDDARSRVTIEEARDAIADIERVGPEAGEDERLRERRTYLVNVERIAAALETAHDAFDGEGRGAVDALGVASSALAAIARYGEPIVSIGRSVEALQSEANELSAAIARERDATEFDAAELETIEVRLASLERLLRRYGGTLDRVLAERTRLAALIDDDTNRADRRDALVRERAAAEAVLAGHAQGLTTARRLAAEMFERRVGDELGALAMGAARFSVSIEPLPRIGPNGAERAELLLAPNSGEPTRPLAKTASGGELSRVLLALVVALADRRARATLVFDEIDAGIGGSTAVAVGARLGRLAEDGQVVCITHLAQIAVWADTQCVLRKRDAGDRTTIDVETLDDGDAMLREIARMLSGDERAVSRDHAAELFRDVQRQKRRAQSIA